MHDLPCQNQQSETGDAHELASVEAWVRVAEAQDLGCCALNPEDVQVEHELQHSEYDADGGAGAGVYVDGRRRGHGECASNQYRDL
jgi:hypothetical protein